MLTIDAQLEGKIEVTPGMLGNLFCQMNQREMAWFLNRIGKLMLENFDHEGRDQIRAVRDCKELNKHGLYALRVLSQKLIAQAPDEVHKFMIPSYFTGQVLLIEERGDDESFLTIDRVEDPLGGKL